MVKHIDKRKINEYEYFIKAISAIAFGKQPPQPSSNLDWNFILNLSEYNNGSTMLLKALENAEIMPPAEVLEKLKSKASIYTIQDANQMFELTAVMEDFEQNGIDFLPLKGYVIKSDYPKTEYRIMSDCDILFKEEQLESVKKVFKNHGFNYVGYDNEYQYHFKKEPFIFIEMHTSLVNPTEDTYDYYQNIWNISSPKDNYKHWYQMKNEDFYLFLLEHASKHYKHCGVGMRILLDIFLYKNKYINTFNQEYLRKQLQLVGLTVFEEKILEIGEKWFVNCNLSNLSLIEEYILLCSTLGRRSVVFANMSMEYKSQQKDNNKKPSKFMFFLKTIFPAKSKLSGKYTYLEKLPFLLPVAWVQMWFTRIFIDRNVSFKGGLKNRLNYNNLEDELYIREVNSLVGFTDK